jgi:hypothetical protein
MYSSANARLILLAFPATQAVLAWSLRFLPRPIKSKLASGIASRFLLALRSFP